ncbi:MAG: hypothetical protein FD174_1436 [Geobacteraceae bacterium]|nr:MAG: hypothetical protein FD174_1436 [Geobacteraceae bacterium]
MIRVDFGCNSIMSQAMSSHFAWLERIQGPLGRLRELDSITKAVGVHNNLIGHNWDSINNCGAIADAFKSHNVLMESITGRFWQNEFNVYNNTVGLLQTDLFDKFKMLDQIGLPLKHLNLGFTDLSTLNCVRESLAIFNQTSAIENALKSFKDFSNISSGYESLINRHSYIFDRINPNLTSWITNSFQSLREIQGLNTDFQIYSDGTVTGFGSSINIEEIQDLIRNKIRDFEIVGDNKTIELKIYEYFESFGNRHPIIRFIMLSIALSMIIGIYINNRTDSSDKIIKYIDHQNAVLLKELKREIKKQQIQPQVINCYRVVSSRLLTVKSSNSRDSQTVGNLYFGQVVEIVEKKRHWSLVEYHNDSDEICIRGWVYTRYLDKFK